MFFTSCFKRVLNNLTTLVERKVEIQKELVLEKKLSSISFALRSQIGKEEKSASEMQKGYKANTMKPAMTN